MIAIGIDIGGQTIRAAVVRESGRIIAASKSATPSNGDPAALREAICRLISQLPPQPHTLAGSVGVAIPGRLAADGRTMSRAVNLPALEGVDVAALLEEAVGRPVALRSDVSMAGLAVWSSLPTPRPMRFVYLSLGTGVGGVAIIDGRLVDSHAGGPAQFGHLIVNTSESALPCRCGARGCLEAYVCGAALGRQSPATGPEHSPARALAIGLQQLSHLWAPDVITIGGGVIEYHPGLISEAEALLAQRRGSLTPSSMTIALSPLRSDDAGVIGAAMLVMSS